MTAGSVLPIFYLPQAQASVIGNLYGWGWNAHGQLGNTTLVNEDTPTRLPNPPAGVSDWNDVEFHIDRHVNFAITSDGRLFGWGRNTFGQMGNNSTVDMTSPQDLTNIIPGITNWNEVDIFVGGQCIFAILPDGRLFGWGQAAGGQLGNNSPIQMNTPQNLTNIIPGVTNWNEVELLVAADHTFAILPDGRLFGWGSILHGNLGDGTTGPPHAMTPRDLSDIIPGVTNWNDVKLTVSGHHSFAILPDGRLFGWGRNDMGQLGNNVASGGPWWTAENTPQDLTNIAPEVTNWNDVELIQGHCHTFVVLPDGRLFGWGRNDFGQIGNDSTVDVITPQNLTNIIPGITNWNDIELISAANHTFAITPQNRMFAWGRNDLGALGLGHIDPVYTPEENTNLPQGVRDWRDLEFFPAWHHNLARVRPLPPLNLTKTLRLNEGTIVPGTEMPVNTPAGKVSTQASFTFRFFPQNAIRINDDPIRYSQSGVPNIADQTITIDPTTATLPVNGVFTATGNAVNIRALIYAHSPLPVAGVYIWELEELREAPNWSGLHNPPLTYMQYDQRRYQIRAHANRAGIVEVIEVYEMEKVNGEWQIVLPKLRTVPFTNTYTRMVGDSDRAALYISKNVAGDMANLVTPFSFTLTLTNPTFTPPVIGTVTAEIVNATTGASFAPPRNVNLTAGTNTPFTLVHNEKLRIPELPAGTRFQVTEAARAQFMPQATVAGSIPVLPATGTYPQQAVDTALPTGTYIIHQVDLNRTSFTNTYVWDVPMGLLITSTPWIALGVVALLLALLLATRNRKRIEEIPLVM